MGHRNSSFVLTPGPAVAAGEMLPMNDVDVSGAEARGLGGLNYAAAKLRRGGRCSVAAAREGVGSSA